VKRLYAAAQHLGAAGELDHIGHFKARVTQSSRGAPGGYESNSELGEALAEVHESGLVGNRKESARHPARRILGGHGELLSCACVQVGVESRVLFTEAPW
jgi:hypothetical protein